VNGAPWGRRKNLTYRPAGIRSEGLRATLVPQFPHLPGIPGALVFFDLLFLFWGLRQFRNKVVN